MLRQLLAFAPASVAPALLSFGFVYVFTRTLTPSEYGTYTLVSNVVMFIQAVLFWSLSTAMVRFYPEAEKTSQTDTLLKTGYSMFAVGTRSAAGRLRAGGANAGGSGHVVCGPAAGRAQRREPELRHSIESLGSPFDTMSWC